jgi:hypothetical protein
MSAYMVYTCLYIPFENCICCHGCHPSGINKNFLWISIIKQEYYMNLCNFEQFLKLSRINKYLLRISLLNKNFFEFLE